MHRTTKTYPKTNQPILITDHDPSADITALHTVAFKRNRKVYLRLTDPESETEP